MKYIYLDCDNEINIYKNLIPYYEQLLPNHILIILRLDAKFSHMFLCAEITDEELLVLLLKMGNEAIRQDTNFVNMYYHKTGCNSILDEVSKIRNPI